MEVEWRDLDGKSRLADPSSIGLDVDMNDLNNISARTLYRVPAQAMKKKSKFLSFLIGYKVSWYRVH